MRDILANKTKDELIEMIEQLSMECDTRHAHEQALEEQLRELGAIPIKNTFLDTPFPITEELEYGGVDDINQLCWDDLIPKHDTDSVGISTF